MEHRKSYIPLPEVKSDVVDIALSFPAFVDTETIGIHINRIERLCRIGGIEKLRVGAQSRDDIPEEDYPMVVGVDAQGGAVSGAGGVRKLDDPSSIKTTSGSQWIPAYRQIQGSVELNMQRISSDISRDIRFGRGIRESKAWSHHLDKSIKKGILNAGKENLLDSKAYGGSAVGKAFVYVWYLTSVLTIARGYEQEGYQLLALYGMGSNVVFGKMIGTLEKIYTQSTTPFRWSMCMPVYGPQLDRLALLYALTKTQTLSKEIEK